MASALRFRTITLSFASRCEEATEISMPLLVWRNSTLEPPSSFAPTIFAGMSGNLIEAAGQFQT